MNTPTDQQTYILQKDLPDAKKGAKLVQESVGGSYYYESTIHGKFAYYKDIVENNPEWFKKEEPKQYGKTREEWEEEVIKCKQSPYYFATTYLRVNDKPFTTPLNEKQFNSYFDTLPEFLKSQPKEEPLPIKVKAMMDGFNFKEMNPCPLGKYTIQLLQIHQYHLKNGSL